MPRRPLLAALLIAALGLTGCGSITPPHEAGGLAVVVGGRSNMPRPALVAQARDDLRDAILSRDTLFIVGVSGRPEVLYSEEIEHDCDSEIACDALVDDYLARIDELVGAVRADTAEADQLGALAVAADQLAGVSGNGPKRIIMIDNGLQTMGDLPMQAPGALSVDPKEQADAVVKSKSLPSLQNVDVLLTGLGARYEPQPALSRDAVTRVKDLWSAVLTEAGAKVSVDTSPLDESQAPNPNQPPVALVEPDDKPAPDVTHCYRIRDDQVGFLPGKDQFRDPESAREVLTPIAADLKKLNVTLSVIGTTALPEKSPFPLSTKRAERVAGVLADLGVRRDAMITGGVGTSFSGFKPDTDADGNLIPSLAVQNRLVLITPVGRSCDA
ncbi:hypothetical protein [Actinoplanes solisilvae]|uniref:hypothetical protein n=1 Tax=Actinoplanes solisilvae TaxID=2486853 RepID=UPI0013E404AB|nr:hypothetical protein [Actinoplanes solisilvae]